MATILPFSEISKHINVKQTYKKALVDTCAIISFAHDTNEFHDETLELVNDLRKNKIIIYSNVNIRSEFIDFHRRLFITEALTSLSQQTKGILSYKDLAKKLKSHRSLVQKRADAGNPLILNDSSIKAFKKQLSFEHNNIKNIWLKFCSDNLTNQLELSFKIVEKILKLDYLSLRKGENSPEIIKNVSWEIMYSLSEKSGLSINDAMILNMFESTSIPFLITTDFDLIYAAAISKNSKLVFCPNNLYQNYIDNYFNVLKS